MPERRQPEASPHLQDPKKVTVKSERWPFKQAFHMQWPVHPSLALLIDQSS